MLHWTDPIHQLALLCGLTFIPHSLAKFTSRDAVYSFFRTAGFQPVGPFVYLSLLIEVTVTVCLAFGFFLPYAAAIAAIFMFTAAASVLRVSGGRWVWNLGGCEFHVFWALCCTIVAVHSW